MRILRRRRDADRRAITVKELAERFEKEHIDLRLKPSTAKGYKRMLERFVIPRLGNHRVNEVTRADIAQLHHDLRHIAYDANRCLEMISKMFNLAEMWGLRPDGSNPRKHIKKYPEEKRERFLSPAELRRVGDVLREMEQESIELPSSIAAIRSAHADRLPARRNHDPEMGARRHRRQGAAVCQIQRPAQRSCISVSLRSKCWRRSNASREIRG